MSAEYAAERLIGAALVGGFDSDDGEPIEDMRNGGFFFGLSLRGRNYEVLVVEVTR